MAVAENVTNLMTSNHITCALDGDSFAEDEDPKTSDESNFNLNNQQKFVVEWMITREKQAPYGGIIANNTGSVYSKMSIIASLLLKSNDPNLNNIQSEGETDLDETVMKGRTLILCSKSEINLWIECAEKCIPSNVFSVCVHYGRYREMSFQSLSQKDIVITTISLVQSAFRQKENNPLYQIEWNRIILDDALCACNHKLKLSKALCQLPGICRWAFAGSDLIENDDEAAFSLIRYVNYAPLNNYEKWKKWIAKYPVGVKYKLRHIILL